MGRRLSRRVSATLWEIGWVAGMVMLVVGLSINGNRWSNTYVPLYGGMYIIFSVLMECVEGDALNSLGLYIPTPGNPRPTRKLAAVSLAWLALKTLVGLALLAWAITQL